MQQDDPEVEFGVELKRVRQEVGLTQTEVAERATEAGAPLHSTAVTRIELGKRSVSLGEFVALSRAVGKSPSEMLAAVEDFEQSRREIRELIDQPLSIAEKIGQISQQLDWLHGAAVELTRLAAHREGIEPRRVRTMVRPFDRELDDEESESNDAE